MTESTFVSYRNGYFRKKAGVKARPVPEMGFCLVYTPQNPNLYTLNPTSWLIMELCDGVSFATLERRYWNEVNEAYEEDNQGVSPFVAPPRPAKPEVRRELREGLEELESTQVIEFIAA